MTTRTTLSRALGGLAVAAGCLLAAAPAAAAGTAALPGDRLAYADAVFGATHNSYSGNVDGDRGSITEQLGRGVRLVEFDVHDNGYADFGDYSVGHDERGDEVDHDGNPAGNSLRPWLEEVATWSRANPTAAPITVTLDLKDDLTDNGSYGAGNMAALNDELRAVFQDRLVLAADWPGALPSVGELRGRVIVVFSGQLRNRELYLHDPGRYPAVAVNARRQVVEVHDSGSGELWYWTGRYETDGRITWLRHGRYDTGQNPAVALNDYGRIVEVHQSENEDTLWYHVGQLGADGEITWSASRQYDDGVMPSVRFVDPRGSRVREIHRSPSSTQNWVWNGMLNPLGDSVLWDPATHAKTAEARYDVARAVSGASRVHVYTGADGASPVTTLRYTTAQVTGGRIRYPQVAFMESSPWGSSDLALSARFSVAEADDAATVIAARNRHMSVRAWGFTDGDATDPPANFPATDYPKAAWYTAMLTAQGAVR